MNDRIAFSELNSRLLANSHGHCQSWLPGGTLISGEYKIGNLNGDPGDSLKVNLRTGKWADFATGERGGDLISLFAAIHKISQADAAKRLGNASSTDSIARQPAKPKYEIVMPVPKAIGRTSCHHAKHGAPSAVWDYHNAGGDLLGHVARYDPPGEDKTFAPWVAARELDGKIKWQSQSWPVPRPLYGLRDLAERPHAPVLICEGEKSADAARILCPDYVAIGWPNGAQSWGKADWRALKGRSVMLWPDNDAAGIDAMRGIGERLASICQSVHIITPQNVPPKFDAADALAEGWDWERFEKWFTPSLREAGIHAADCAAGGGEAVNPVNDKGKDFDATIEALAALRPHEYDRVRTAEATRLRVRTATLDDAVKGLRAQQSGGAASLFTDVEPWPEPVNGAALLDEISSTVRRFIVCDPEIADVAALWIAFTWLIEHFHVAPMILITAPEMRCGKTQLLTVMGKLVKRPLAASNISPAATYRVIEAHAPTLLIDEADAFFRENEELRGIINSGHGRDSAYVLRTVGDNFDPKRFSTWGAKVLCGIGRLQATLMDRSLVLELRRKGPGETAAKLRHADPAAFRAIASRLARYADDHGVQIGQARPNIPNALHDRAQDNWEPLLAIADFAGGGWPERARSAALKMAGAELEVTGQEGSLLADIAAAFANVNRLSTADLLAALVADDTKPYATWARGKPMTARHLAKRLQGYKIFPRNIRTGGEIQKGYLRADFADVFARYIPTSPDTPFLSATPLQPAGNLGLFDNLSATSPPHVADRKSPNQLKTNDCSGVADKSPLPRQETSFDGAESELEADL
ncbi:MAG: DUF3631 domain-containing protein [Pseudomonadota bacterium]